MSVWFRGRRAAARSAPAMPFAQAIGSIAAQVRGTGGEVATTDQALRIIAVRSSTDLIASLSSELPVRVVSGHGAQLTVHADSDNLPPQLRDPDGTGYGLQDWSYRFIMSLLTDGNTFGDVLDRRASMLMQVELINPSAVHGWIDDRGVVQWTVADRPAPNDWRPWHTRANPLAGYVKGLSPIQQHAVDLGLAVATNRFGLQWFNDGAHPTGILSNSEAPINPDQARTAKERFISALRGNREPLVLGKGWKYDAIQISPNESQFLESRGYSAADCCRIFGPGLAELFGYPTDTSMKYANRVDRVQDTITFGLNKWFNRLERALTRFVSTGRRVEILRDAMLIANILDRLRAEEIGLRSGLWYINELRDQAGKEPVAWGDKPFSLQPGSAAQAGNGEQDKGGTDAGDGA